MAFDTLKRNEASSDNSYSEEALTVVLEWLKANCHEETLATLKKEINDQTRRVYNSVKSVDSEQLSQKEHCQKTKPTFQMFTGGSKMTKNPALDKLAWPGANTQLQTELNQMLEKNDCPSDNIHTRKLIKRLILEGQMKAALDLLNSAYPAMNDEEVMFELFSQCFLEYLRNQDFANAISFMRSTLVPFGESHQSNHERIMDLTTLLAFEKPELSPLGDLMDSKHWPEVAEKTAVVLLKCETGAPTDALTSLLKQLLVTSNTLAELTAPPKTPKKKISNLSSSSATAAAAGGGVGNAIPTSLQGSAGGNRRHHRSHSQSHDRGGGGGGGGGEGGGLPLPPYFHPPFTALAGDRGGRLGGRGVRGLVSAESEGESRDISSTSSPESGIVALELEPPEPRTFTLQDFAQGFPSLLPAPSFGLE